MKRKTEMPGILCAEFTVAAMLVCCAAASHANGYKILCLKGVKASSMGDAWIAGVDDASAVAMNPAGLARIEGSEVSAGVALCNAYSTRTASEGGKSDNESRWQMVPSFFMASDLNREDVGVGLGVSLPNGLSSEWADDGFARYVSTYSSLTVADISPALGVKVTEKLMAGIGLDFYYSEARLERMLDMGLAAGAPGTMDVESRLKGTGTAWGFNGGFIYEIDGGNSVALTYRHPFTVNYDGTMTIGGNAVDVETSVDFPAAIVAGYAFKPGDKWKLEFDADWTHWKSVDDITVKFADPGMPDVAQEQNLDNTMVYKLGAEYRCTERTALRCGYIYNENATPEESWRPSLPDADNHFFTAGIGHRTGNFTVDVALQLIVYERRTIDNNVDMNETLSSSSIDGRYRTVSPVVGVSTAYKF